MPVESLAAGDIKNSATKSISLWMGTAGWSRTASLRLGPGMKVQCSPGEWLIYAKPWTYRSRRLLLIGDTVVVPPRRHCASRKSATIFPCMILTEAVENLHPVISATIDKRTAIAVPKAVIFIPMKKVSEDR